MKDNIGVLIIVGIVAFTFILPNIGTGVDKEKYDLLQASAQKYIEESHESRWDIDDEEDIGCGCNGREYIEHGDGHRTPCPCLEDGNCKCESEKDTGDKN
jgi:hypothetical protein